MQKRAYSLSLSFSLLLCVSVSLFLSRTHALFLSLSLTHTFSLSLERARALSLSRSLSQERTWPPEPRSGRRFECEGGPLRAVHLSRHKWPGGCYPLRMMAETSISSKSLVESALHCRPCVLRILARLSHLAHTEMKCISRGYSRLRTRN